MKVLITGGVGFIGSHLSKKLVSDGHKITILDNFSQQVHGNHAFESDDYSFLNSVQLVEGDVRNKDVIAKAISDVDAIVHLAAETGTGQSMYEIEKYETTNVLGTLNIIEHLMKNETKVKKVVVASSRAIYGEGAYFCSDHNIVYPKERFEPDMKNNLFEVRCPICRKFILPCATSELAPLNPLSYYALTKQVQEQMVLMYAKIMGISGIALRYQNVYGPGQSLENPYTGIMAIFSSLARKSEDIRIFEDGNESRDFVYIDDVVDITAKCVENYDNLVDSFNIGSGCSTSVNQIATEIVKFFDCSSVLKITGEYRLGDIRHNFADLTKASEIINYSPKCSFDDGLKSFLNWSIGQPIPKLFFEKSLIELSENGLFRKSK